MNLAKNQADWEVARGYSSSEKAVCPNHVDDEALRQAIRERATEESCSYCDPVGSADAPAAAAFDDFMDRFMVGIHHRYVRANDEGVPFDEGDYVGVTTRDSDSVADEIFGEAISGYSTSEQEELLADIQSAMIEDAWVERDWQWRSKSKQLSYNWDEFKKLVKHQNRFWFIGWPISEPIDFEELTPARFFQELVHLLFSLPEAISGIDGPMYRGRMFRTEPNTADHSASTLGPAPEERARASRMSPAGISMFYGATDLDTAIAEIGTHSSDTWAVTGEFRAGREIRVIDLTNLPPLPSVFDTREDWLIRYESLVFLRRFVDDITQPVVLDGREHIDYVPTQVFTEYLRYSAPGRIDGLVFPSAQGAGRNVVVFYGPEFCSSPDEANDHTRLVLDPVTIEKHRVTTVIRRT